MGAPGGFSGQLNLCLGRRPHIASVVLRLKCLQSAEALSWYPKSFWTYICSITLLKYCKNQTLGFVFACLFFFPNDIRCYSHIFSPFKSLIVCRIGSVAGNFSFLVKLKISAELHSCWLCPYEQLPFRFLRWRRFIACSARLSGNEYELKGLYLRTVSSFCLRGFFFSYITKFPHKIDILGKGQRQTGDYRSNWISTTFHCKGQPSAASFQPMVPHLISSTGEIFRMPKYLSIYLPSFLPFLISSSFLLSLLFLLFSFSFILSCYLSVSFLLSLLSLFSHYFPQHPDPAQLWAIATNKNWKQWPIVTFDGHQKSVSQTQKQVRNTQFGEWYCLLWTGFASNFSEETEEVTSNYLFPMLASGLPWTLWSIQNTGCGVVLARCRITYCVSEIYTQ